MGCTGEKTYEEAVQYEIRRYLNNFNLLSSKRKEITDDINNDLQKRSKALQNYQYIYREEDVKQTVDDYKILIWEKYNIGDKPYHEINIEENNNDNEKKKQSNDINNNNKENNNINN